MASSWPCRYASRKRLGIRTTGLMLRHVVSQDGFTQPARTTVDQHNELLLAQANLLELASVQDFLNRLEFGEVVSASERSKRVVEVGGLEFLLRKDVSDLIGPDVLEVEGDLSPAVELCVTADQVGLEQGHSAADIATDQVRVDYTFCHQGSTDRRALPGMQIRNPDGVPPAVELRGGIELAKRLAFDPTLSRGEKAHRRCGWIDGFLD